jgi:hypothetical protein
METVVLRREQTFAGVACAGAPPGKVIVSRARDFLRSEMGLIGQRERGHLGPSRWQPRKKRQFNARRPIQSRSSIHSKLSAKPVVLNYPFHDKPPGITRNRFSGAVDVGFLGCVASQHTRPEMPCFRLAKCGLKLGLPFMWRGQYAAKGAALHLRLVGQFDCGRIAGLNRAAASAYSAHVGADTNLCGSEKSRNWLGDRYSMARW